MKTKTTAKQIRKVAFNPITGRFEVVHPEDETEGTKVITQYWSKGCGQWVCIPDEN